MSWETPIWFALVFTVLYTFFFYREIYLETLLCAVVFIILGGTEPDVTFNAIKRVFLDITIDDFSFRTLRMVLVIASILWLVFPYTASCSPRLEDSLLLTPFQAGTTCGSNDMETDIRPYQCFSG